MTSDITFMNPAKRNELKKRTQFSSLVSIIIPCRNEERYIDKCLENIVSQSYPKEKMEVFVIDGASEDKTREIIGGYVRNYPHIRILENAKKYTPFGLNIGIKESKGDIIARMDSHAGYDRDYIAKCVKNLQESGADNVGGIIKTLPAKDTLSAKAIALSLSHPFGAAGSYFRTGSKEAREVDTVFGGCYKRGVFDRIGLFNEKLIRSQDIEFNRRLKANGGKIILFPDIQALYYPQASFVSFFKHNFLDGIWTIYPISFGIKIFSLRHLIPLIFVLSLLLSIILGILFSPFGDLFFFIVRIYILTNLIISFWIAFIEKNIKLFFFLPIAFASRHFGYGFGSLWALVKLWKK